MVKRPVYKRIWDFLGSRNLSVFIFVMGMTYFLMLAVFAIVVPLDWVTRIGNLLPYKVLYIIFFINLIICEIRWIPVVIRKCKKLKRPETVEDWQRFGHGITVQSSEFEEVSEEKRV